MYILIYGRDYGSSFHQYTVLYRGTLADAARARSVSGDLVFDESTGEIVQDDSWLFPWERDKPDCYARRKIAAKATLVGSQRL